MQSTKHSGFKCWYINLRFSAMRSVRGGDCIALKAVGVFVEAIFTTDLRNCSIYFNESMPMRVIMAGVQDMLLAGLI